MSNKNLYWLNSVSRVVFFMVAFTVCLSFVMKILPAKEFMILAAMAFSFFFGVKQVTPSPTSSTTTTETTSSTDNS